MTIQPYMVINGITYILNLLQEELSIMELYHLYLAKLLPQLFTEMQKVVDGQTTVSIMVHLIMDKLKIIPLVLMKMLTNSILKVKLQR